MPIVVIISCISFNVSRWPKRNNWAAENIAATRIPVGNAKKGKTTYVTFNIANTNFSIPMAYLSLPDVNGVWLHARWPDWAPVGFMDSITKPEDEIHLSYVVIKDRTPSIKQSTESIIHLSHLIPTESSIKGFSAYWPADESFRTVTPSHILYTRDSIDDPTFLLCTVNVPIPGCDIVFHRGLFRTEIYMSMIHIDDIDEIINHSENLFKSFTSEIEGDK